MKNKIKWVYPCIVPLVPRFLGFNEKMDLIVLFKRKGTFVNPYISDAEKQKILSYEPKESNRMEILRPTKLNIDTSKRENFIVTYLRESKEADEIDKKLKNKNNR